MSRNGYDADVDVLTAPLVNAGYGVKERDWAAATRAPYKAWVGSASTTEQLANGTKVTTRLQVNLPAEAVVTAADRIRWAGRDYSIDGDPQPALRHGQLHHYEVAAERVAYTTA